MSCPAAMLFALVATIALFVVGYFALMHLAASTIPPPPKMPGRPG